MPERPCTLAIPPPLKRRRGPGGSGLAGGGGAATTVGAGLDAVPRTLGRGAGRGDAVWAVAKSGAAVAGERPQLLKPSSKTKQRGTPGLTAQKC